MKVCPFCGADSVHDLGPKCPNCGRLLEEVGPNRQHIRRMILGDNASDRYKACDFLRMASHLADEDAALLRGAAKSDEDSSVRGAATQALAFHGLPLPSASSQVALAPGLGQKKPSPRLSAPDLRREREMLVRGNRVQRYEACELMRVAASISDEDATLLRAAAEGDTNADVREAASHALALHRPSTPSTAPQTTSEPQSVEVSSPPGLDSSDLGGYVPPVFTIPSMPSAPLNSPEYISALEKRVLMLEVEMNRIRGGPTPSPVTPAHAASATTGLGRQSFVARDTNPQSLYAAERSQPVQAHGVPGVKREPKKVWLAVVLNLFPLVMGIGYLYLGEWPWFLAVLAIQLFSLAPMTWLGLGDYNKYLLAILWAFTLLHIGGRAKRYNSKLADAQ